MRKLNEPADLFRAPDMVDEDISDEYEEIARLFCDSSGLGGNGESALTKEQATEKAQDLIEDTDGQLFCALTGIGQFQVYVSVFKRAA